jgi:hypothetical protein
MKLNEYCEYIRNPLAEAKARVVTVPPGESWTTLRRFYHERGDVELCLSDLVRESAWLPMPDEVFGRVRDKMQMQTINGHAVVLLGMPGYLALLKDEHKRATIVAIREWVDGVIGREAVCLLRSDDGTGLMLREVFANPRYRQGKQLNEIDAESVVSEESGRIVGCTEVMLIGQDLTPFIPEACETFSKYLRYTEEHPNDSSARRIVVASEGRELAGLSAEVRQLIYIRDFVHLFYGVDDLRLSEDTLRWMCARGKEGSVRTLLETLRSLFFPEGGIEKCVLRVFDRHKGVEREALMWLVKHVASKGSYLSCIVKQESVHVENFRSAYISGAAERLDDSGIFAGERRDAIRETDLSSSDSGIQQFITRCKGESSARVVPWLNCRTDAERAELLRRCSVDGFVSNAVKEVYQEAAMYLNTDLVFGNLALEEYFSEYRELKMASRVTPEFYEKAQQLVLPSSIQSRDSLVQQYSMDKGCALLVVDAMGAEWLPMLVSMARERNLGIDSIAVGEVHLPTSTIFNTIYWPDIVRRLPDIKRLDNIAHNGTETHEERRAEENLVTALGVIGGKVLPLVVDGLQRFERVLVTADHGSSRLAVLAWQSEPKLTKTLSCEECAEVADWRYRERSTQGQCPRELEETLDGRYWVMRGYDRLPKRGSGHGFEVHGGATLEERLVPVVIFSRIGYFMPKTKISGKRVQIVEKADFDL